MALLRRRSKGDAPEAGSARENRAAQEAALLARVARGEREGPLGTLYDRYGGSVYGLGIRLLGDRGMAEELVQDTFVRLWRAAPSFDPGKGSARTLLYEIARRAAIDLHRRAAVRPRLSPFDGDESQAEEGPSEPSESGVDRLVLGLAVREALDALSEEHRETLELHYREDLTQRQIAERLEVPLGTVKTRTFYGLKALRQELEEREVVG